MSDRSESPDSPRQIDKNKYYLNRLIMLSIYVYFLYRLIIDD